MLVEGWVWHSFIPPTPTGHLCSLCPGVLLCSLLQNNESMGPPGTLAPQSFIWRLPRANCPWWTLSNHHFLVACSPKLWLPRQQF